MKKIVYILLILIPSLAIAQVAPGTGDCVSSLDFGNPSTFVAPDCGSVNPAQWSVSNDSCTLGTAPTNITLGIDSVDITICGRVNPSGNLESNDRAYLKYTIDGIQTTWDTVPGDRFTKVTEICVEVKVRVGAAISAEISYVNNHQSEHWRLKDGGIEICYTTPVVLPVQLTDFTASLDNGDAIVEWTTASETSNSYFIVERSYDGINFNEIEQVSGVGFSSSFNKYSIIDYDINIGLSYYRLTQVDYDGNYTVFNVIALNNTSINSKDAYINVIPNPADKNSDIEVEIDGFGGDEILCSLVNAYGIELYSFVVFSETNNRYVISSSNLPLTTGVYFVKGSSNGALFSKKIVVQ